MDKRGSITIKDIARELGISPSTVSRALKNHPDISKKTCDAVQELAAKYHYKPNAVALSLRSRRTNMIGVLIPGLVHYFFSSVISGIEHVANDLGYSVLICQSDEEVEREVAGLQTLTNARVDGVLVSVSKNTTDFNPLQQLVDNHIPLVFFDRAARSIRADKVVIDDVKGAMIATEHLIQQGCKKIVHLAASDILDIGVKRKEGYKRALAKYNIPYDEQLVFTCDSREEALVTMQTILDQGIVPDGVFAVNDLTATGALKILKQNGYKIPEQVKVVGFSDGFAATVVEPALTTIDQHGFEIGMEAARLLIQRINGEVQNYSPVTKVIPVNLIERGSTNAEKD